MREDNSSSFPWGLIITSELSQACKHIKLGKQNARALQLRRVTDLMDKMGHSFIWASSTPSNATCTSLDLCINIFAGFEPLASNFAICIANDANTSKSHDRARAVPLELCPLMCKLDPDGRRVDGPKCWYTMTFRDLTNVLQTRTLGLLDNFPPTSRRTFFVFSCHILNHVQICSC